MPSNKNTTDLLLTMRASFLPSNSIIGGVKRLSALCINDSELSTGEVDVCKTIFDTTNDLDDRPVQLVGEWERLAKLLEAAFSSNVIEETVIEPKAGVSDFIVEIEPDVHTQPIEKIMPAKQIVTKAEAPKDDITDYIKAASAGAVRPAKRGVKKPV